MSHTMKDIAAHTGLSLFTVSKYVNGGRVKPINKLLIDEAIEKLDFKVNRIAQSLKTSKTKIVGVLIPTLDSVFTGTIISAVEDTLLKNDYGMIVCDCRDDAELEYTRMQFLLDRMVDGIIYFPYSTSNAPMRLARQHNIPIVLMDRQIENADCDVVLVDNIGGSYNAVEQLIICGHKRIGIICGPNDIFTHNERLKGYKRAMSDYSIPLEENLIKFGNCDVDSGFRSLKELWELPNQPTAVFVTNYTMTLGAIMAVNKFNIHIPQELSLIGFDNIELSMVVKPSLSLVVQPMTDIGKCAAELILKRLRNDFSGFPTVKRLKTELNINESVCNI